MTALALALSYTERFIPLQLLVPLPGIKLGLANIVTLVVLYRLRPRHAFAVLLPRCILGAVFGGGITGLLFSLTGGILALLTMAAAKKSRMFSVYGVSILGAAAHNIGQIFAAMAGKLPVFSVYGVSILGAAAHNVGQILSAMVLMRSVYVAAYLPWLLLAALVTGLLTGTAGAGVLHALQYATVFSKETSR